ncbi:cytochrome c oxidase subunit 1 [Lecanora helva]
MPSLPTIIFQLIAFCATVSATANLLNITTSAPVNGISALECWQLESPLIASTQSGTKGSMVAQLGNLANASYSIIPKGTNGGLHTAPVPQYAVFVAGAAKISIPGSKDVAHIKAGKNGLVFAADTAALSSVGHVTYFTKKTFLMQIPVADGIVPNHTVLYSGPCKGKELMK